MRVLLVLSAISLSGALRRSSKKEESQESSEEGLFFHRRRRTESRYAKMGWKQHFNEFMKATTATSNPEGFNPKCEPYIKEPRGESKGLILLQHGYSACPGFWYLLTPGLVQRGWTVMAPILPGHGRNPKIEANRSRSGTYIVTDYSSDLPQEGEGYEDFAKELIEMARKYKASNPGKKMVLNGCSHGGAVAAYMAMNGEVGTWDRLMLMNPFLAPPTAMGADFGLSFLRHIIPAVLPAFEIVRDSDIVTWGPDCDAKRWPGDPRNGGSGGICQFDLKNFRAVLQFGNMVEGEARVRAAELGVFTGGVVDRTLGVTEYVKSSIWKIVAGSPPPSNLDVQLLTTSKDNSISNARVHFAAAAFGKMVRPNQAGYCAVDAEFSHTYINPPDKEVDMDMWWLDARKTTRGKSVVTMYEEYLCEGIHFPTSGTVQDDKALIGDPRCDVTRK